ncbi:MAG: hypothetical protein U0802_24190 [Candidatus Binatia bacterium]
MKVRGAARAGQIIEHRPAAPRAGRGPAQPGQHTSSAFSTLVTSRAAETGVEILRRGLPRAGALARRAQLLALHGGVEIADGDRQGGVGLRFQQAEARHELGQGREGRRLHGERGARRQGAAGVVAQLGGQLDAEAGLGPGRAARRRDR